jgi:cupin domain
VKRRVYLPAVAAATVLVVLASVGALALASPPSGVTPTLLARGTYDAFKVRSLKSGPLNFKAKAKTPLDLVVRKHDYLPGSTTGWHSHPGPVFITVTQGELTYYHYDDPTCTPHVVSAGQGFVDNGRGHIVRNQSGQPAQDVSVIIAPVAGAFRGELPAPGPHCGF